MPNGMFVSWQWRVPKGHAACYILTINNDMQCSVLEYDDCAVLRKLNIVEFPLRLCSNMCTWAEQVPHLVMQQLLCSTLEHAAGVAA
jgi:hypothetical protein